MTTIPKDHSETVMEADTRRVDHIFSGSESEEAGGPSAGSSDDKSDGSDVDDDDVLGSFVPIDLPSAKRTDAKKHGPRPLKNSTDAWIWSDRFQDFIQRGGVFSRPQRCEKQMP